MSLEGVLGNNDEDEGDPNDVLLLPKEVEGVVVGEGKPKEFVEVSLGFEVLGVDVSGGLIPAWGNKLFN